MLGIGKLRQAEVDDLDLSARGQQDVGALDVAVYNAFLVRGLQALRRLGRDVEGFVERQGTAADLLVEAGALDVGHRDEDLAVDLVDLMNRADVGMIDRRRGLGFASKTLLGLGVLGQPRGEKLQGDGSVEVGVEGFVNHAHPAFPEFFEQTVVRDDVFVPRPFGQPDDFSLRVDEFDRTDEAITAPRQGFDQARLFGGITQRLAQSLNGRLESLVEICEGPIRPEPLTKSVPSDELPGAFEQGSEDLERLFGQTNLHPALAKLAGFEIQLEGFKPRHPRNVERLPH